MMHMYAAMLLICTYDQDSKKDQKTDCNNKCNAALVIIQR